MTDCFHCGEMVPQGCLLTAKINGVEQPMCCIGCQAVAQFLTDNDHQVFYQYREDKLPQEQVSNQSTQWTHLDAPEVFEALTKETSPGEFSVNIKVEGMYCSACGWLLQKVLSARNGIEDLLINAVTQNIQVKFRPQDIGLSEIFAQISALGYHPMQQQTVGNAADDSRKSQLKKIAVAGFGMMFIMTLAVPLYSPDQFTLAPHIQRFFLMISLLIATAVYFYSAQGFVQNALRDLKNKHLGMDVPIALSISLAYFVSLYLSFKQEGHVYFDSMTMFVFFLLLGRYVESQVRHQGMNVRESLFALIPVSTERIIHDQQTETVPLAQIVKGDRLLIRAGSVIPCDGKLLTGQAQVNEALLTGESKTLSKKAGDLVYAGSQLTQGDISIETSVNNDDSFLAKLAELMETAQSRKPPSLQLVDQIASYFVAVVLLLALGTTIWYSIYQQDGLMTALLSVLIATCPCALSLATPTAMTAASINLLKQGVLVNNTEAITQINAIKHWFFDKTGTLTDDRLRIIKQHIYQNNSQLQAITYSLQKISNHPIASAFSAASILPVTDAKNWPGQGVSGRINQQHWLMGSHAWLSNQGIQIPSLNESASHTCVFLACEGQLVAAFELDAAIRSGAEELLQTLRAQHKRLTMLSGDHKDVVNHWGQLLAMDACHGGLKAIDKIKYITDIQQQGQRCVMVGDGVNDAPVLSQADVSVSLKQGAHLAHSASDLIVLGKSLNPLIAVMRVSNKTQNIIKQNLSWSLLYNLSITPIAMMGLLAPWLAAIGMSLSSLLVVFNSRRLL